MTEVSAIMAKYIQLSPNDIVECSSFPDDPNDGLVYEHLLRYCSRTEVLPAVFARFVDNKLVVTRGHKYLSIAKELGFGTIRGVLLEAVDPKLNPFLKERGIVELSVDELRREEDSTSVQTAWHVIFVRSLDSKETCKVIDRFKAEMGGFLFETMGKGVALEEFFFREDIGCIEMKFLTPCANHDWTTGFMRILGFLDSSLEILSYQGRRFKS